MKLASFALPPGDIPSNIDALRKEVRDFLADQRGSGGFKRTAEGWDRYDPQFSRKVAQRGWIGMTWPKQYGGHERSSLERYVVSEELLTAGAPVRAHWLADRQIGPLLLATGTEQQKQTFLPKIAAGQCFFCVGLSEPDAGSDLASIRTRAEKVDGGWRISGTKIWTSYAHLAHFINLFARTERKSETDRHGGVTQFIVDLKAPGIKISPVINLARDHDFNEVVFDDVFVADNAVIGSVGSAWKQVSDELAHERAGPERWVNSFGALATLIDEIGLSPDAREAEATGRLVSHLWTLHRLSFSISALLQRGEVPEVEAAIVKDLGTNFDQRVPEVARGLLDESRRATLSNDAIAMLDRAMLYAPATTIRGGTREILRGIIAKGLGLR